MHISSLTISSFKNIAQASLSLSPKVNCFIGDNGMGKSNLLDAIYYLSYCRSYTGLPDGMIVTHGDEVMFLSGEYLRKGVKEVITAGIKPGERKVFKSAGKEYTRLSDHLGRLPLVLVSPWDSELIEGTSDVRRRFMDMTYAQGDAEYMDALLRYRHGLEQRNRMLRDGVTDDSFFEAVEMQMDLYGRKLMAKRSQKSNVLLKYFNLFYTSIAGVDEGSALRYKASAEQSDDLLKVFFESRSKDRIMKYSTTGPHRDDLSLTLKDLPAKKIASQGQSKTFTVAMRLAQYCFLKETAGLKPILLLDDIFDKLDSKRVELIINLVAQPTFGQIFITDTDAAHISEMIKTMGSGENTFDHKVFNVKNGQVS